MPEKEAVPEMNPGELKRVPVDDYAGRHTGEINIDHRTDYCGPYATGQEDQRVCLARAGAVDDLKERLRRGDWTPPDPFGRPRANRVVLPGEEPC